MIPDLTSLLPALQMVGVASLLSQPWAVDAPSVAQLFLSGALRPRADMATPATRGSHPNDLQVYEDLGFAIQPVRGVVYPGASRIEEAWDGLFNTDRIHEVCQTVAASPGIHTLVFQMDTPGGSVFGLHTAAQAIADLQKKRPDLNCMAYVGHLCASAGMYLAAACDSIHAAPGALVGSIGTISGFTDTSGLWEKMGLKKHLFTSDSTLKGLGHGGMAPTPDQLAHMAQRNDTYSAEFKSWMTERRGLKPKDMLGQTFEARMAPKGMVDTAAFTSLEQLLAAALKV